MLFADVTYSFYPVYGEFFRTPYRLIESDDEFNVPVEGYLRENGGIIIANPNAPSGRGVALADIENILGQNEQSVVILDEAYVDFGGDSAVGLINRYPNLLVIRTLSKSYSLAGLRVGFALGNKDLIEGIIRVKDSINSYTVDRLAQAGAKEAMKDDAYFQETRSKIITFNDRCLVIAAVSVVLPWSICPIVPMLTWGFFRSNFFLAMMSSPSRDDAVQQFPQGMYYNFANRLWSPRPGSNR